MKTTTIKNVTITVNGKNEVTYTVPTGWAGKKFAQWKRTNKAEINQFINS